MTSILIPLFIVLFHSAIVIESYSYVDVDVYKNQTCEDPALTNSFERTCWSFISFQITGVSMSIGSCLHIYKGGYCSGDTYKIAYPMSSLCEWDDYILSVKDCTSLGFTINCPDGTYVRKMEYGVANERITIHCYKPGENAPTYTDHTFGNPPSNPIIHRCTSAAHGLSMQYDPTWETYFTPSMECSRPFDGPTENKNDTESLHMLMKPMRFVEGVSKDKNITFRSRGDNKSERAVEVQGFCSEGMALSGIFVNTDEARVVKEMSFRCAQVADPTTTCEPQEMLGLVKECDNSESSEEMECSYVKTFGVGQSKNMSDTERQEMAFVMEFGFSVEAGIPGLSASMSASLGQSELVEYEWTQNDTTTWIEETTVNASIQIKPYTRTKLEQLIGKCSFYGTSVNFFKQTDINFETGEQKIKYFTM